MKIKHITLLIAFTLFGNMLYSQAVPMAFEDWKTTAGTQNFFYKNVTKTDAFGNIYVAGATVNGAGNTDILLAKYNSAGVQLWIQQYAGVGNGHDFAAGLVVTDTYAILTGAVTTNTASPTTDIITMKYSSAGVYQWATTYNGSGNSFDAGKHVILDPSGNVYITGGSYNASGNIDFVTIKYNTSGIQQWVSAYDYTSHLDDSAIKVVISGSNLTVTGPVTISTNNYKLATLTYAQSNGSLTATNISTVTTTSSVTAVTDLTSDGSGNIYIVGSSFVSGQGYNYYVQKLNSTLVSAWTYTYNGASNLDDVTRAVQADASGNVYISGYSTSSTQGRNIVTMKLNSSGTLQWTQTINGSGNGDDEGADMILDASTNLYITGYQTISANNTDYYTIKYNSSTGAKIWDIFTDGMSLNDQATNMALDSLNNVIVTGQRATSPNTYNFMTVKYVQKDITNPVDLNGEASNKNIGFHTNKGQIRDETAHSTTTPLYYTHNLNPEIYLEKGAYNYVYMSVDTVASSTDSIERISVTFSLSSNSAKPYGYSPKGYPLNYFLGDVGDPITNVRGYDRVVTQDLYQNIDLHYFSNSKGLKYYFVVKPGGSVKDIRLNITGATTTTITSNNLFIDGVMGDITLKRPNAYMVNSAGVTTTLTASSWVKGTGNNYTISTPSYTTTQTLIIVVENIPPASVTSTQANLDYSTYYGGNGTDYFRDIKVASNGNRAVCGQSSGGTFPTVKAYQSTPFPIGSIDATVLKYTADDTLRYCTYYGASGPDWANSVAINSAGNVFIAGFTQSSDLVITNNMGETNQAFNGNNGTLSTNKTDGFIIKFDTIGTHIAFGRYVGGSRSEYINSIYIDGSDNLYFTGTTSSDDLPVVNAYSSTHGTTSSDDFDMLIGKMNSSQVVSFLTYFGGNALTGFQTQEYGNDILTDNSGNIFVVGESDETSFPVMNPTPGNTNVLYDASSNGYADGAIVRLSSGGTPNYATFVGGNFSDRIYRAVYNPSTGDLYFAGNVSSTSGFPLKQKSGAYYDGSRHAGTAAFIGYINSSLEHQWITHYGRGGSSKSFGVGGLSRDNAGLIYLSGQVYSDSLVYGSTTPSGAYTDNTWTTASNTDGFIAVFDANKQIYHAHYFGGSSNDYIYNSDCNGNYNLYVTGNTASNNFPIAYNATNASLIDSTLNNGVGSADGFISRFSLYPYNFVGVKEQVIFANNVIAFPNPANNFVSLKINAELKEKVTLKVYNTVGQIVHEETIFGNEQTIDCNKWASGMYIFVISNKEFNSSFKIVKE